MAPRSRVSKRREATEVSNTGQLTPRDPFPFFSLPSEIRNQIYSLALTVPHVVDLAPTNYRDVAPLLKIFFASRRLYNEAYPVFYSRNTFRIFPTHPQFFGNKEVILSRIPRKYRKVITSLELRLGPGWGNPPKGQEIRPSLGLNDLMSLRCLRVFVECDPSQDVFKNFRIPNGYYTHFSCKLLRGILRRCLAVDEVEFDAYPSVNQDDELIRELTLLSRQSGKRVTWGPLRGWTDLKEPADLPSWVSPAA